jgi:hypothetical protein
LRGFATNECEFSSFAYLIDLGHMIGLILSLGRDFREPFEPNVISADVRLTNWALYLPELKHMISQPTGKVDEILFQAHTLHKT